MLPRIPMQIVIRAKDTAGKDIEEISVASMSFWFPKSFFFSKLMNPNLCRSLNLKLDT